MSVNAVCSSPDMDALLNSILDRCFDFVEKCINMYDQKNNDIKYIIASREVDDFISVSVIDYK